MSATPLSPTARSTLRRHRDRARADRRALYAVLDEGLVCHLGIVVDGAPRVLPTLFGRHGETLYLHGSSAAASLAGDSPVCVTVTLLDGLVYARSVFHHSANYRSAVLQGVAQPVLEPAAKLDALRTIVDHLTPGSWDHARRPSGKELAATAVLALELDEASVKVRTGPPGDDEADVARGSVWAGVLPVRTVFGEPEPCPLLPAEHRAAPPHVRDHHR